MWKRPRNPKLHSHAGPTCQELRSQKKKKLQGRFKKSQPMTNQKMTLKPGKTSGVEPRVQFSVPKKETFPISVKYIDVSRTTQTSMDVSQEIRIDDYWNIDVDRNLSDSWIGFMKFIILNEKLPKGKKWCGWRVTKKSSNYQT